MKIRWLGRMAFADALALQEQLVAERQTKHSLGDELLLLEHDPVYTIGRTPDQTSLRGATHLPYPLFPINRGGQATYHGPGQLMGYPIIDLRKCGQDLHRYLRWLEDLLNQIVPCGIANVAMTSIEKETRTRHSVEEVAKRVEQIALKRISLLRNAEAFA